MSHQHHHDDHDHHDHHDHGHHEHPHEEGHHHHHEHGHDDQHRHDHDHEHHHGSTECCSTSGSPTEKEKLVKIVHHWIHHNEEHARSYREWGDRARALGQDEVGGILDSIAEENLRLNEQMQGILGILQPK